MSPEPTPSIAPPLIADVPDDPPVLIPALASALLALIVNTDRALHHESADVEDSRHSDGIAS